MTITPPLVGGLVAFAVVFSLVFGLVTLWRRRIPGLGIRSSTRGAIYLSRYAMALEYYGMRAGEIRSHVDGLRGDLGAVDAADFDDTLQRFGPPRTLAAEVTNGMLRPSVLRGTIWFAFGVLVVFAGSLVATEAFLGGFEATADPGQTARWSMPGFETEATMGADGHASSIGFGGTGPLLVPLLAFAVGAKLWRLPRSLRRSAV